MLTVGQQCRKLHTLKTLTWQLQEWTCSMYSPCSLVVKESTWIRKGTPFSPPCFLGVNSVLIQFTWEDKVRRKNVSLLHTFTYINVSQIFHTWMGRWSSDTGFPQTFDQHLSVPGWKQKHSWQDPRWTRWCWGAEGVNEAPVSPLTAGYLQVMSQSVRHLTTSKLHMSFSAKVCLFTFVK